MFIITEKGIINSDQIGAFRVVSQDSAYPGYKLGGYQLRAYHSGYMDDNGNADYFLVKEYKQADGAYSDLNMIAEAHLNGARAIDLR